MESEKQIFKDMVKIQKGISKPSKQLPITFRVMINADIVENQLKKLRQTEKALELACNLHAKFKGCPKQCIDKWGGFQECNGCEKPDTRTAWEEMCNKCWQHYFIEESK